MSTNNDFVPLDKWPLLERDRIAHATAMSIEFLKENRVKPAITVLEALSNRLAVDASVLEYFDRREEGEHHVHQ